MQLTTNKIKPYREKRLEEQGGICPLCGLEIEDGQATLDHCHDSGHVRQVLHRSCNGAEGRILSWAGQRSKGDNPVEFLHNLLDYWSQDYSSNPLHPSHGKPKRKRKRRPKMKRPRSKK